MQSLYKDLDQKKFLKRSAILLILADFLCFFSLYKKWTSHQDLIDQVMQELSHQSPELRDISQEFVGEMTILLQQSLLALLILALAYHAIVYYFYQRDAFLARKYVNFSVATSLFGFALYFIVYAKDLQWYVYMVILALPLYAYQFMAPKHLKKVKTEE